MVVGGPNGQAKAGAIGVGRTKLAGNTVLNTGTVDTSNLGALKYLRDVLPACGNYSMRCYDDNVRIYQANEVAINWNAPLFWMAEFLNEQDM